MKNAYRKTKQFIADHDDAFFLGTVAILTTATTAAALYLTAKEVQQIKEINEWTRDRNFEGKAVYQLADGSYIAVSQDQVS